MLPFSRFTVIEQAVQVVQVGRIALHAGPVPANQLHGLVQSFLPPTRDEHLGPSSTNNLALASAIPLDPPVITATLPIKLSHDCSFRRIQQHSPSG